MLFLGLPYLSAVTPIVTLLVFVNEKGELALFVLYVVLSGRFADGEWNCTVPCDGRIVIN